MSDNKIQERIVGDMPISKSFKGILRVSNVKEIENGVPDVFLKKEYYGDFIPSKDMVEWEPSGSQETTSVLNGTNIRYKTEDEYTNLKIPVTDSLGNYMNFSLGLNASLIGKDSTTGKWDFTGTNFYTLDSEEIHVGLEDIAIFESKKVAGGKIFIDNRETDLDGNNIIGEPGKIVVDSYYYHNSNRINEGNGNFFEPTKKTKTIYQSGEPTNQYDAFLFDQESYESNDKERHNIVKLKNLKNYVLDKVSDYIKSKNTEIPPGTIIWQYASLDKWYCRASGDIDDFENWQGYRPALGSLTPKAIGSSSNTIFAADNTNQGVYSRRSSLKYRLETESSGAAELPPEFKRGYALADGTSYQLSLIPPFIKDLATPADNKNSLELFFKLFFTIGYYYTHSVPMFPIKRVKNGDFVIDREGDLIGLNGEYKKIVTKNISKETSYGVTLAIILAFKKLCEGYKNDSILKEWRNVSAQGQYNETDGVLTSDIVTENIINWLSKQKIDKDYIFNTVFTEETLKNTAKSAINNIIYTYKNPDGEEIDVILGKEVKSFTDYLDYYYFEEPEEYGGMPIVKHTAVKIIDMAEIREMASLFARESQNGWDYFKFRFNVPALYTDEDTDVISTAYTRGNFSDDDSSVTFSLENAKNSANNGKAGLFVGSSGLLLSDRIRVPAKSKNNSQELIYENIQDNYTYQNSICSFTMGYYPHSHALAKGILYYKEGELRPYTAKPPKELTSISVNLKDSANIIADDDSIENHILAADITWENNHKSSPKQSPQSWANEPAAWNYFLQERWGDESETTLTHHNYIFTKSENTPNGIIAKEMQYKKYFKKPENKINEIITWYGRTSGPIWDKEFRGGEDCSSKYVNNPAVGYFKPQSVKLLPLIKL